MFDKCKIIRAIDTCDLPGERGAQGAELSVCRLLLLASFALADVAMSQSVILHFSAFFATTWQICLSWSLEWPLYRISNVLSASYLARRPSSGPKHPALSTNQLYSSKMVRC